MNLILLPTLECNAACCYCFENKNKSKLSHDDLIIIIRKVLEYLDFLLVGLETIEHPDMYKYIQALDQRVNEYEEKLREDYSLKLKR